ncbi:hypothetical protein LCGC14_0846740 [marine sediment metagenome]|uniref:NTP pyrophosphohydrolase MazG putative catalytic core domain-containing protein n=1 Tax=marine sediment metagenome TaxID=412755 RepID=A0A0F9SIJ1_9ZZZZ
MQLSEMAQELRANRHAFPNRWTSPHQGYAIILEELDELWEEIRMKTERRSAVHMRQECIQIAAMSIRFIEDLLDPDEDEIIG